MPDYLQHLASRITGRTPAVQPRLPSLFEPPLKSPNLGVQPASAERIRGSETSSQALPSLVSSQLAVSAISEPSRIVPREQISPPGLNLSPSQQAPSLSSIEIRERQPGAPPQIRRISQTQEIEDRGVSAQRSLHPKSSETVRPAPIPPKTNKKTETPESSIHSVRLPQDAAPAIIPRTEVIHPTNLTNQRTQPTLAIPSAKQQQREAFPAHATILNTPQSVPAAQTKLRQPDSEESSALDIHVVIGTVTVQAILPPPVAPAPQPRSTPKLTLEQYLEQREGRP
jgi:hypothetical protein